MTVRGCPKRQPFLEMIGLKDKIKASAVNFKPVFADKKANIEKIIYFMGEAARQGSDIVVLPELCLTGYDVFKEEGVTPWEKMNLCETVLGRSIRAVTEAAKKCGIYTVLGFGERYGEEFYNSAAFITPDGETGIYRKMHLFDREGLFFSAGSKPFTADTPWGRIAIGICYDTYNFPELLRYYACTGARLYLNPTAMALENESEGAKASFCGYYRSTLEYDVINTGMFIVSSNLCGVDKSSHFGGGSVVMGVGRGEFKRPFPVYYAGSIEDESEGIFTAELDLSMHNPRLFKPNPVTGDTAFKPELYIKLYEEIKK